MTTRRVLEVTVLAVLVLALGARPGISQEGRADLIERARGQFDNAAALDLLMEAADPVLAEPDSLWAVSIFDIALVLMDQDRSGLAATWLRFAARQAPAWSIDRGWFPPSVVGAYDAAIPAVRESGGLGDPGVSTAWRWPSDFDLAAEGTVEVEAADSALPLTVEVVGSGTLSVGAALALAPGSYEVVASAPGFEETRVTREVLPGVTTVLTVDLAPTFASDVEAAVRGSMVRIRVPGAAPARCVDGVLTGPAGTVLTSRSALMSTSGLEVETASGTTSGVSVVASDEALDLAVLRIGASPRGLPSASGVSDGTHAWALFRQGCGGSARARTRLTEWVNPPSAAVSLATILPTDAVGGPLVDLAGDLIGVVTDEGTVVPAALATDLLRRTVAAAGAAPAQSEGGGPPWALIGAGVAAAGVAAALLMGGGGNGGGEDDPPTTGGIRITFPGGGP